MAAASGRQPESLFGHLMLRPVWREGAVPRGPGFAPVVQLVALTGLEARGLQYSLKGLLGGYDTAFLTTTMAEVSHETMELEQRSVRRFRLWLTQTEQVRLLERIWELERRGYFPYRFLTENCASALVFLLNGALEGGRKVRRPGALWVLPSATLDMLSRVEVVAPGGETQPLLEYIPDDFESTEVRAERAYASREELLSGLSVQLTSESRARLRVLHWRLRSARPEVRRATYIRMPEVLTEILRAVPAEQVDEVRRQLHAYVAWSVRVERGAADRAEAEKLEIERNRVLAVRVKVPSAAEGVRDRQRQFEREDELQRRLAVLDRISLLQEALAKAPRRPATPEEQQVLERAEVTEAAFIASTEAQGTLQEGALAHVDPAGFLAEDQREKVEGTRSWAGGALVRSGAARTVLGMGVDFPAAGGSRPVLVFQYREHPGAAPRPGPGAELTRRQWTPSYNSRSVIFCREYTPEMAPRKRPTAWMITHCAKVRPSRKRRLGCSLMRLRNHSMPGTATELTAAAASARFMRPAW